MQEEFIEYATFTTVNKEGNEIEMAIVDEFQFEHKNYVVGALIEDDMGGEFALVSDGGTRAKIRIPQRKGGR